MKNSSVLRWGCLIVVATAIAYGNSFSGPFVFDDATAVVKNRTIRHLWPIGKVLLPPSNGASVQRRPVVNLSFAINYALSGEQVWSYHALNLAAHVLAALLLFGVVRRTLLLPGYADRFGRAAAPLACAVAIIWAAHPLLTDAVTYIAQRTEVLAGLFYLLALYATIRGDSAQRLLSKGTVPFLITQKSGQSPPRPRRWYAAAVAACLLAMGSKESAISAPLVILLYDRVFLCPSWREVFRRRAGLYAGMAVGWLFVLAWLPYGSEGTDLFGAKCSRIEYALTQPGVIAHYLWLCFWPHPLVLDYGVYQPLGVWQIAPYLVLIVGLLVAVGVAFRRQPWLGFLGVWFFAILAPSSSVVPIVQQIAGEKRMYLPLAAVVTGVLVGGFLVGRRLVQQQRLSPGTFQWLAGSLIAVAAAALATVTLCRNVDYRSELSIWRDTVAKMPNNQRALANLATAISHSGRIDEAIALYREHLRRWPDNAITWCNLGIMLGNRRQLKEAMTCFERAAKIDPHCPLVQDNIAKGLLEQGRYTEAIAKYEELLKLRPDDDTVYDNLGMALASRGQVAESLPFFQRALELRPDSARIHDHLGRVLLGLGRFDEAVSHLQTSLQLDPQKDAVRDVLRRAQAAVVSHRKPIDK